MKLRTASPFFAGCGWVTSGAGAWIGSAAASPREQQALSLPGCQLTRAGSVCGVVSCHTPTPACEQVGQETFTEQREGGERQANK